jgi:hypothetical protein
MWYANSALSKWIKTLYLKYRGSNPDANSCSHAIHTTACVHQCAAREGSSHSLTSPGLHRRCSSMEADLGPRPPGQAQGNDCRSDHDWLFTGKQGGYHKQQAEPQDRHGTRWPASALNPPEEFSRKPGRTSRDEYNWGFTQNSLQVRRRSSSGEMRVAGRAAAVALPAVKHRLPQGFPSHTPDCVLSAPCHCENPSVH